MNRREELMRSAIIHRRLVYFHGAAWLMCFATMLYGYVTPQKFFWPIMLLPMLILGLQSHGHYVLYKQLRDRAEQL